MTARFELRSVGVFDRDLGVEIPPGAEGWREYEAWLAAGGVPDPEPAPDLPPITYRRAEAAAMVNQIREEKLRSAVVAYAGHNWDADPRSIQNLVGVLMGISAGISLPPGFTWRTADNQSVAVTPADLVAIGALMQEKVGAIYAFSWSLKDGTIASSDSPESLDLAAGWP